MAISYVGGTTQTDNSANASYTVDVSGIGIADGDLVVVNVGQSNGATATLTISGDQTGAYSYAYSTLYADDTRDSNSRMGYAFAGATPDATLTVSRVASNARGSVTVVMVFRGVDPTTPLDGVTPTTTQGTNGSLANPPSITPSTSGAWVVGAYAGTQIASPSTAWTAPANMTAYLGTIVGGGSTGAQTGLAYYSGWSSGSFDPDAVTGGHSGGQDSWTAGAMVLRPEAALEITPTGPTVTVAAGTPAFGIGVTPTGPTVSVTPGTATVAGAANELDVTGPTVTITPGAPTFGIGVAPTGPTVTVTPGAPTLDVAVTPTGPTVTVTPGSGTVSHALSPTAPTVAVTPGALGLGQDVAPAGPTVAVSVGAASLSDEQFVTPTGPTVTITPGAPSLEVALSPTAPTVAVTPGTATLVVDGGITAEGPTVGVTVGTVTVSHGITAEGPTVGVEPGVPLVGEVDEDGSIARWRRHAEGG